MPEFDVRRAGQRLASEVGEAYGKPGLVKNKHQLSERSGLSRSVIDGWWKGSQPTPDNLQRAADTLGVPVERLWLRWLGYELPEPGLTRIAEEIERLRQTISRAGGGDEQLQDALASVSAAQEDQPAEPEEDPPAEPVASSRRRRSAS